MATFADIQGELSYLQQTWRSGSLFRSLSQSPMAPTMTFWCLSRQRPITAYNHSSVIARTLLERHRPVRHQGRWCPGKLESDGLAKDAGQSTRPTKNQPADGKQRFSSRLTFRIKGPSRDTL